MPILLGTDEPRTPSFFRGNFDFDDLFRDRSKDNFWVYLVGLRRYTTRYYYDVVRNNYGLSLASGISDIEMSVLISDSDPEIGRITPLYYLEINPFDLSMKTIDRSVVEFVENKGDFYGIISPFCDTVFDDDSETAIKIEQPYVFPAISIKPFCSHIMSREELCGWVNRYMTAREKTDERDILREVIQTGSEMYDRFVGLFGKDNFGDYSDITRNRRRLLPEHRNYRVFSLREFGRKDLEKLVFKWRSIPRKAGTFLFGSDSAIRRNLGSYEQAVFHASEALIPLCTTMPLLEYLQYSAKQGDFVLPVFLFTAWMGLGLDYAYRLYKTNSSHPAPKSGIVRSLYERVFEEKRFF
ncbi:hypothetical protein GF386_01585 [Candidatus Pacearchaeota archaeon]|nr:hypothetical protein [Candidatus Pacearchaeota archaeon]MBD3282872.1 hypothetical protein [Candidatus Pacearchaeota archaeon]